jgi:hypothetical protein
MIESERQLHRKRKYALIEVIWSHPPDLVDIFALPTNILLAIGF